MTVTYFLGIHILLGKNGQRGLGPLGVKSVTEIRPADTRDGHQEYLRVTVTSQNGPMAFPQLCLFNTRHSIDIRYHQHW